MIRNLFVLVPTILLLVACGGDQPTDPAPVAEGDAHEGHSHEAGAHGGPVVILGDHAAHIEALHDMVDEAVDVWVSDGSMSPMEPDEAPVLNLATDEGSVRIVATKHGDGWRFVHEEFAGHPENARLNVKIGGKTYTPDLPHGHADDAHDEHDDDGHDDDK